MRKSPQQDLNLGLHFYIDGAPQSAATIDASKPGTHQVDYVAIDQSGRTATSTRTVIVSAPASTASGGAMSPLENVLSPRNEDTVRIVKLEQS